jgi:O-antigen/teichoic acid export membrane protein
MNLSNYNLGLYSAALQITSLLFILVDSFNTVYQQFLYKSLAIKYKEELNIKMYVYISLLVIASLSCIIYLLNEIIISIIYSDDYKIIGDILLIMLPAPFFYLLYLLNINYLLYYKKNTSLPYITLLTGIITIPILYYSSDVYGLIGLAYSYLLISILKCLISYIYRVKLIGLFHG